MKQADLNRAVARATGETVSTVKRLGFLLADPSEAAEHGNRDAGASCGRRTTRTNDNASSADPVLADIDGDGNVEIIKSVDNYAKDDAHNAVYAFETDGKLLWKVPGLSGEDSPAVGDLDSDGQVEIVGMTFGGEVYCLDPRGDSNGVRNFFPTSTTRRMLPTPPPFCAI
jgi:hypothetical protein